MRKNIKKYIYVITTILLVVLSACSNKANDNNTPKSVKESTTTFSEDTTSDVTISSVETTTEEDTTESISESEQEVSPSTDEITSDYQIQETTIISSVNSTTIVAQNSEMSSEIATTTKITSPTTPRETIPTTTIATMPTTPPTTTPATMPTTPPTTTPATMPTTPMYSESLENNPSLRRIEGIMYEGFKFSSKNHTGIDKNVELEITIDSVKYYFDHIDFLNSNCQFNFDIDISFTSPCSLYFTYDIYNSNNICVKTDTIEFIADALNYNNITVHKNICISLPIDDYTIKFSNPQLKLPT